MHRRYRGTWALLPVALIASLIMPGAWAQETTAGVQGSVKDPSGAAVVNATVEVAGPALLGTRKLQTDDGGNYRFAALPPGTYTMTVSASGFRNFKQGGIDLTVGRQPTIDIRLEVGAVTETVEVSGEAPMVDTTQSKVAVTVPQEVLDNLPKGRSFQSIIPFAPGARGEPLQSGSTSGGVAGYQIDGASDSENVYMVDGVNITNIQNGGVGKSFQMEFIDEVQVKTSSFEAEYGGALGGVVNVVPKHGSNEWHGSLIGYLRSNAFNANNSDRGLRTNPGLPSLNTTTRLDAVPEYYMANKDQETIIEPGYQIGGPALKNKLWLFSSYIPSVDTTRRVTNFTAANPGPRTLTADAYRPQRLQPSGLWRDEFPACVRLLELRVLAADGDTRRRGQPRGHRSTRDAPPIPTRCARMPDPSIRCRSTPSAATGRQPPSWWSAFVTDISSTTRNSVDTPVGTRYVYQSAVNASSVDLSGAAFPGSSFNNSGLRQHSQQPGDGLRRV